jgi:hypothetical protein
MDKNINETMTELESMLTIMNIEGMSSTCYVYETDFGFDKPVRVRDVSDNFGNNDVYFKE